MQPRLTYHTSVLLCAFSVLINALSGIAASSEAVAINPTGDAEAEFLAISGTGTARATHATCVNLIIENACTGGNAASVTGDAHAATDSSDRCTRIGQCIYVGRNAGGTAISGTGGSAGRQAMSGSGDATGCDDNVECIAISGMGKSAGGIAVSGNGTSDAYFIGASGAGDSRGGFVAISGIGDAESALVAGSGSGSTETEQGISVSLQGDSRGLIPVSVVGDSSGLYGASVVGDSHSFIGATVIGDAASCYDSIACTSLTLIGQSEGTNAISGTGLAGQACEVLGIPTSVSTFCGDPRALVSPQMEDAVLRPPCDPYPACLLAGFPSITSPATGSVTYRLFLDGEEVQPAPLIGERRTVGGYSIRMMLTPALDEIGKVDFSIDWTSSGTFAPKAVEILYGDLLLGFNGPRQPTEGVFRIRVEQDYITGTSGNPGFQADVLLTTVNAGDQWAVRFRNGPGNLFELTPRVNTVIGRIEFVPSPNAVGFTLHVKWSASARADVTVRVYSAQGESPPKMTTEVGRFDLASVPTVWDLQILYPGDTLTIKWEGASAPTRATVRWRETLKVDMDTIPNKGGISVTRQRTAESPATLAFVDTTSDYPGAAPRPKLVIAYQAESRGLNVEWAASGWHGELNDIPERAEVSVWDEFGGMKRVTVTAPNRLGRLLLVGDGVMAETRGLLKLDARMAFTSDGTRFDAEGNWLDGSVSALTVSHDTTCADPNFLYSRSNLRGDHLTYVRLRLDAPCSGSPAIYFGSRLNHVPSAYAEFTAAKGITFLTPSYGTGKFGKIEMSTQSGEQKAALRLEWTTSDQLPCSGGIDCLSLDPRYLGIFSVANAKGWSVERQTYLQDGEAATVSTFGNGEFTVAVPIARAMENGQATVWREDNINPTIGDLRGPEIEDQSGLREFLELVLS